MVSLLNVVNSGRANGGELMGDDFLSVGKCCRIWLLERTQYRCSHLARQLAWSSMAVTKHIATRDQDWHVDMRSVSSRGLGRTRRTDQHRKRLARFTLETSRPMIPALKSPSPTSPPPHGSCPPPPSQSSGAGLRHRGWSHKTARPAQRPRPSRWRVWPVHRRP